MRETTIQNERRKRCLLWYYFRLNKHLQKTHPLMGRDIKQSTKYRMAGEKAFYEPDSAGRLIGEMIRNPVIVREVQNMSEEEVYGDPWDKHPIK